MEFIYILESILYALHQAHYSMVLLHTNSNADCSDELVYEQHKSLVDAFDKVVQDWDVPTEFLKDLTWYDEEFLDYVRNAKGFKDLYK